MLRFGKKNNDWLPGGENDHGTNFSLGFYKAELSCFPYVSKAQSSKKVGSCFQKNNKSCRFNTPPKKCLVL